MKKKDLERVRSSMNTQINTKDLRTRVSSDLNVVKDAYDLASQILTEMSKLVSNLSQEDKPVRALAELARAHADVSKSLVALRAEGRTTIREAVDSLESVTPLGPAENASSFADTPSTKILPPRAEFAIGEFLKAQSEQGVIYESSRESVQTQGTSGRGEGSSSSAGLHDPSEGECGEGNPED